MERVNVYLDFLPTFLGASPDGITERGSLVEITKVASKDAESREDVGLVFVKEMLRKLFWTETTSSSTNFNFNYAVAVTGSHILLFQMKLDWTVK